MDAAAEERQRGASSTPLSAGGACSTPLTARGPGVPPTLFLSLDRPSTSSAAQRSVDLDSPFFWQDGFSVEDSEVERCQTAAAWHESGLDPGILAARDREVRAGVVVSQLTKRGFDDHFRSLGLKDYFDEFGQRRFENLSMTIAASTFPELRNSFGSHADYSLRAQDKQKFSAKAYRLSTAVVERDRLLHRHANAMRYKKLSDEDKNNRSHVNHRQQSLMFAIANPQDEQDIDLPRFLPACCGQRPFDNVPLDCGLRRKERDDRKQNEKLNMLFSDSNPHNIALVKSQGWLLSFEDIQMVLAKVTGWMSAAGLLANSGIDRSTFCQMLVDLDMIDQVRLPYVWTLQVFDLKAKPMKLCAADPDYVDQTQEGRVATVSFLSKWDFIAVMDILIQHRFMDDSPRDVFMNRFRHVVDFLERGWRQNEFEAKEAARAAQLRIEAERDRNKRGMMMRQISGQESTASNSNGRGSATPSTYPGSAFPIAESQTWKHDRNILGMLKEPEVMQILEQFRFLFRTIFNSYASDEQEGRKSMSCEDVLTFCYDFKLVPRLASRHEVARLYSLAICVEELTIMPAPQPQEDGEGEQPPQRSDSVTSRNSDTNSRSRKSSFERRPGSQSKSRHRASFGAVVAKATQGKGRSTLPGVTQPKSPSLKGSRMKALVAQAVISAGVDQEEEEEPEDPAPTIVKIFGMSALAETLLRLAFGYFLTFGNYIQLAMNNRAKIFWLFAFIRANLVQLRGEGSGQQRQTAVGAFEGSRKGGLARLLACLNPEAFDEAKEFTLQAETPIEDAMSCTIDDAADSTDKSARSGRKAKTVPALALLTKPPLPLPSPRLPGPGQGITKLVPPEFKKDSFIVSDLLCGKLLKSSVDIQSIMAASVADKKSLRKRVKKALTRHQ